MQSGKIPELIDLRSTCGDFRRSDVSLSGFQEIRPGFQRKIYSRGAIPKGRWQYSGAWLQPYETRCSGDEITALVNNSSLNDLQRKAHDALTQILYRAHSGDQEAIAMFVEVIQNAVSSLERLAAFEPEKTRLIAERSARWSVLLSLNPYDMNWAREHMKLLRAGAKTPAPPRPRQRVNPRNFWTRLAGQAHRACLINRTLVPWLEAHAKGARKKSETKKFWGTTAKATVYYLDSGDVIVVTDWQKKCPKLREPITNDNFDQWWKVIKRCVLQYWQIEKAYGAALREIGQVGEEEWRRRDRAIDRVKQALRGFLGLP